MKPGIWVGRVSVTTNSLAVRRVVTYHAMERATLIRHDLTVLPELAGCDPAEVFRRRRRDILEQLNDDAAKWFT